MDRELDNCLPKRGQLAKAMRYSIFAGGKRFRPLLCLAAAKAVKGNPKSVLPFAAAVEMIHTFTLIHDDLPAMDNAALRRGKPALHLVFGEAIAILAGDALNTLAFQVIASYPAAVTALAKALIEVVGGQVLDLESVGQNLNLKQLIKIHQLKTAALLQASLKGSALICRAASQQLKALTTYAQHLGLAFQITDDILDATATTAQLGKPVQADTKKGFPYYLGLPKARRLAKREKELALAALKKLGPEADWLRQIAAFVVERNN